VILDTVARDDAAATTLLCAYADELAGLLPPPPIERAWGAEYTGPRGRVVIARDDDGTAIACAGLREHARDVGETKRFYVAPRARRRGVARAVLARVESLARELGYRRLVLDTASPLVAAARFYERSGYATVEPFNENPHAALWFEKKFDLDDAALWGAFTHSSLPSSEWVHRTHLRVAFMHLARWSLDESHLRMRVGIIRLNAWHGLEETAERGYHETLTRVWLALVAAARRGEATSDAFVDAHPELLDKKAPLRFYNRETMMSLRARTLFVEPDLAPLP
jgi:GNAT superfamily N-acetyltransferase